MIYTLISLLVLFWIVGLIAHIGGSLIHTLLVLALIIFIFNLITGRKTSVQPIEMVILWLPSILLSIALSVGLTVLINMLLRMKK